MTNTVPVKGYDGKYLVDEFGNVYTVRRRGTSGGILPQRKNSTGYMRVDLQRGKTKHSVFVHRLVADAFIPKIDGKNVVNHKDGNKLNNHVSNLEWCTHAENIQHAYANGLVGDLHHACGEKHHGSKLSDDDVISIYKEYRATHKSSLKIAKQYEVSKRTVLKIVNGKRMLASGITVEQYVNNMTLRGDINE